MGLYKHVDKHNVIIKSPHKGFPSGPLRMRSMELRPASSNPCEDELVHGHGGRGGAIPEVVKVLLLDLAYDDDVGNEAIASHAKFNFAASNQRRQDACPRRCCNSEHTGLFNH